VPLVHDDQVDEALAPQCPDQPFGDRVRARGPHRRQDGLDPETAGPLDEVAAVDGVAVPHEVPALADPRRRRDQLAPDPSGGWAGGHVQVHQLAPGVADEHEHVQRPEGQALDRE
jgi:hypothetical protein